MLKKVLFCTLGLLVLMGCTTAAPTPVPPTATTAATATAAPTATSEPTPTTEPTATSEPTATATAEPSPTPAATLDLSQPNRLAPDIISTDEEEWRITFTPDGQTAYFGRSPGFSPNSQGIIMVSHLENGVWSQPEPASFSGEWNDTDPYITADGQQLYFCSKRPVDGQERKDFDIWVMTWDGTAWGEPVNMAALNSPKDDLYVSITNEGILYFGSDRSGGLGGWDIYRALPNAEGVYETIENVGKPINTPSWEFNPHIAPDGSFLLFTGLNYAGGRGFGDIYVARPAADGSWGVKPMPKVNSTSDEYHPGLSPDGEYFYFVRRQGDGDLHFIPAAEVLP